MAPRTMGTRRNQPPNDRIFELGVQGRKTGVTLRDTGARDEHGMQPLGSVFSSPEKTAPINGGTHREDSDSDSSGQDMDIENTTAPDPAGMLNGNLRLPLPRSRSPIKTFLQSPARQNPHLGPNSSPVRGSIVAPNDPPRGHSARRKLDFSMHDNGAQASAVNGGRMPNGNKVAHTNGLGKNDAAREDDGVDEEAILHGEQDAGSASEAEASIVNDDDGALPDYGDNDYGDDNYNDDVELGENSQDYDEDDTQISSSRRKSRKSGLARDLVQDEADEDEHEERAIAKKRKGPRKKNAAAVEDDITRRGQPAKRRHPSGDASEVENSAESEDEPAPAAKRRRAGVETKAATKKSTAKQAAPKSKFGTARKPRNSSPGAVDTSLAVVPRGPPLPKGRGLMISRREAPDGMVQTRSGRNSYRPLAFWRNEHVDYDQDEAYDDAFAPGAGRFVLPSIKEVHRVDELTPPRRGRPAAKTGRKRASAEQSMHDEPVEPWEADPGTVTGDAVVWQPEFEYAPPGLDEEIEVAAEQLAVAGAAVETREIRGATFRFAKTLSLPFFGAGIVDLPPHSEKRPKNARKMYMAFFVFAGRVRVSVNESLFRIGRGGTWFVPRGNTYSIENDYDEPARIFFSQGCEPTQRPLDDDEAD